MAPAAAGERSLKETPTWAVAIACAVFILISIIIEQAIHALGKWFQKRNKKAMLEALEKIKAELMLLGFISLLLTVGTRYLPKICIPEKYGNTMLPCELESKYKDDGDGKDDDKNKGGGGGDGDDNDRRRKLLEFAETMIWRRVLAAPSGGDSSACSEGKVPLISPSGMHQLHIFIFVLAVFHILYSVLTMALAHAKVAFFRQFFGSVTKVDYLTMRHGFINILLLVGTKLELIIMEMAQEMHDRTTVVKGAPVVEPSNKFFWFNRPEWILLLIHFTLFQNAFQMAYFLWTSTEFGFTSCFHENLPLILTRVFLGVALQILCSYITFPLYALITQMGSHMKKAIFEEQTAKALKNWQKAAKQRKKLRKAGDASSSGFVSGENTPSQGSSPLHLLHNQKHRSNQSDLESVLNSPRSASYQSDTDLSEREGTAHDGNGIRSEDQPAALRREGSHSVDFSFVKP
ncbi:hypothetical protein GBA52_016382 [Prunus armeniaca]|nr:hypothetical protein GBA52_016382 [Prunus armeniaca]